MKDKIIANAKLALSEYFASKSSNNIHTLDIRGKRLENLKKLELPNFKQETWRYSNISSFDFSKYIPSYNCSSNNKIDINDIKLEQSIIELMNHSDNIVFYNGELNKGLSSYHNHIIVEEQNVKQRENNCFFTILNSALANGCNITIPNNTQIAQPITLNYIANSDKQNNFNYNSSITLKANSKACIIEQINNTGAADSFINNISSIELEHGAQLDYYLIQISNTPGINIVNSNINLHKDAKLNITCFNIGNSLNHTDLTVNLMQPGAEVNTLIANNAKNKENHNLNLTTNHIAPNCSSNTLYRSVLEDKSMSSFTGNIVVEQGASSSNADLQCKSLVVSKSAVANAKPQLIINCDDVKCSHGASIGHIDEESLFYLRSRGLSIDEANSMLVSAFVEPVLEKIKLDKVTNIYRKLA